jgi:hypothetical protein
MLNPAVQAALVVILAALLQFGARLAGIEIDEATVNTLAGVLIVWLLSKLGLNGVARLFGGARERGLLKYEE